MKRFLVFVCLLAGAAEARAQHAPPVRFEDRGLSYAQAWEAAKDLRRPLVVFVNVPVRSVPGCMVTTNQVEKGQWILVNPDGGSECYWLPGSATNAEILRRLQPREVAPIPPSFRPVSFQQSPICIGGT